MSETVPFEGVEKRLVIQFADGHVHYDTSIGLGVGEVMKSPLLMTTSEWQSVLDFANCEIVSQKYLSPAEVICTQPQACSNDYYSNDVRVYLLSESTLTVWSTGFLMKTCGRTTPFLAMARLLEAYRCTSLKELHVSWMTYSRLDFLYPEYQIYPHQNFPEEIEFAQRRFTQDSVSYTDYSSTTASDPGSPSGADSSVECGGCGEVSRNSDDEDEKSQPTAFGAATLSAQNGDHLVFDGAADKTDETFSYAAIPGGEHVLYVMFLAPGGSAKGFSMEEVLMTKIREDCVRELTGADSQRERAQLSAEELKSKSLLREELHKTDRCVLDEYWFDPCGYSANILMKSKNGRTVDYFSTHISPEKVSSYASLELGTWGCLNERSSVDEFSLRSLIHPFAPVHQNYTKIVIAPYQQSEECNYDRSVAHTFLSAGFSCQVTHCAY